MSPRQARVWTLAFVVVGGLAGGARAQDDEEEGPPERDVTTTAVLIEEQGAGLAESTIVSIGLRRGVQRVEGVRFLHAADLLSNENMSDEVIAAIEDLDAIADMVRTGDAREAQRRAEIAIEAFEGNLEVVKRSQLIDAYMLRAAAACRQRDRHGCLGGFEYVVTFRESFEYATARYPRQFAGTFERVREDTLQNGARGSIQVTTEPEGAEVFVDGRSYGPAPVTVLGLVTGRHYVTIKALGFEKVIRRITVYDDHEESYFIELSQSPRSLILQQNLPNIRGELGRPRAGATIEGMKGYLFTNQLILGVVRPAPGNQIDVTLYLYDQRTRFKLAELRRTISADAAGMVMAQEMAQALYEGVDLTGAVEAPEQELVIDEPAPFWQQWWFWTAVGVVVVSGIVAIGFAGGQDDGLPEGWNRVDGRAAR